jgi:nucleotide-binding universal stress UspA family protein
METRSGRDPMTGLIICGVDDSESAKRAARVARDFSKKLGLGLMFVRVVAPGSNTDEVTAVTEDIDRLNQCATGVDLNAGWHVELGHPADVLVTTAADKNASLMVVGSTGPRSSLLGSISAEVSRRAPCPVLVVPPGVDGDRDDRETGLPDGADAAELAGGIVRFSPPGHAALA